MNVKEMLQQIREEYPNAKHIEVTYGGSGDSFDDFYSWDITEGEGSLDYNFRNKYYDLLDAVIVATGDGFDNDGSQGTIHIDLAENKVWAEHYYVITDTEKAGDYYLKSDEELAQ